MKHHSFESPGSQSGGPVTFASDADYRWQVQSTHQGRIMYKLGSREIGLKSGLYNHLLGELTSKGTPPWPSSGSITFQQHHYWGQAFGVWDFRGHLTPTLVYRPQPLECTAISAISASAWLLESGSGLMNTARTKVTWQEPAFYCQLACVRSCFVLHVLNGFGQEPCLFVLLLL